MYEPDSDVLRWGLNLLDVDQNFSSAYYGDSNQQDVNVCHEQNTSEIHYETDSGNVENDEIIAETLQEELSNLSIAEASEPSHGGEEYLQASSIVQDWHSPPTMNYYFGLRNGLGEANDIVPTSSCSSPGGNSYDGEEYSYTLDITDESALDGEVGKRFNQMIPVPHVPRINGDIPSIDEATSDHQRLLDRLQFNSLVECKVQGDGNCQFRALSDQFYRTTEHHKFVRRQIVKQLKSHSEMYKGYVPMAYGDYLRKMSKNGEWGDHVTLQAAADSYGVKIRVITSFKDTCFIEILPKVEKSKRVLYLSFWAEVHYNSIYPQGELLPCDSKTKKRWRIFGNKH